MRNGLSTEKQPIPPENEVGSSEQTESSVFIEQTVSPDGRVRMPEATEWSAGIPLDKTQSRVIRDFSASHRQKQKAVWCRTSGGRHCGEREGASDKTRRVATRVLRENNDKFGNVDFWCAWPPRWFLTPPLFRLALSQHSRLCTHKTVIAIISSCSVNTRRYGLQHAKRKLSSVTGFY
ncbi:hypothetical protein B0H14DRAFT_3160091 [Mycena olivaceomarginata]|nr:hypothetical protein B0H14DRAFT_3160091 [Mycena olivaceomarginata]